MENSGNTIVVEKTLHLKNEFCENENIPALHVYIDGKKKKKFKETRDNKYKGYIQGSATGWRDWSIEQVEEFNKKNPKVNRYKRNAYDVKIEDSKWMVLDIDYDIKLTKKENEERKNKLLEKYGNYNVTYSVGSKYPHLYRLRHPDDHHKNINNYEEGLDLRYTNVFEYDNSIMYNLNLDLVFDSGRRVEENEKPKKPKKKRNEPVAETPDRLSDIEKAISNEDREILENIDKKFIDDYNIWLKLIWGLYNKFECVDICDWLSQRGDSYQGYDDVKNHIENDKTQQITYGTVIHYSKESNLENYMEIRAKYFIDLKPSE